MKNLLNTTFSEDKLPKHLSMNPRFFDKYDDYYKGHWGKQRRFFSYLERFLESRIGKSYNKAFSDFIKTCKTDKSLGLNIGGLDVKGAFKDYFDSTYYPSKYVVINNVIKKNPARKKWTHTPPMIRIKDSTPAFYVWNDAYEKYNEGMREAIYEIYGKELSFHIFNEHITPEQVSKYTSNQYSWRFDNRGFKDKWGRSISIGDCFLCISEGGIAISKGDEGYDKAKAELVDAQKKMWRDAKREKKERGERLLHDIMAKKKREEEEKNRIDRDRLGFDENSFMGEPYHGQKRKKNKS